LTPPAFLRLRGKIDGATERIALRAVLTAARLLGVAIGTHLREIRGQEDPLLALQARLEEAELRSRLALEIVDILGARFAKIPEHRRPYYSPVQRFRILEIRNFLGWNAKETAKTFLVCPHTVLNWERVADPVSQTAGSTVKPQPPIRRAADVVHLVAQNMVRLAYGGQDMIARILASAGWDVSARSVARYAKEKAPHLPSPAPPAGQHKGRPVIARFLHHTWMMDVSELKQLLGPPLHMAAVFDAFSRVPLALRVFDHVPNATEMAHLFKATVKAFTKPKYLITDQGGEFTGGAFQNAVKRLGTKQRFASKENLYATARLERFWRTLKESARLYRLVVPLSISDLETRLELALTHYIAFRPHQGLQGATPAEALLELEPAHRKAVKPPRGLPRQQTEPPPFAFAFLADDPHFPILAVA